MVHVLASLAFTLIALAASGLILATLVEARTAIATALGMVPATPIRPLAPRGRVRMPARQVRVTTAARPVRVAA